MGPCSLAQLSKRLVRQNAIRHRGSKFYPQLHMPYLTHPYGNQKKKILENRGCDRKATQRGFSSKRKRGLMTDYKVYPGNSILRKIIPHYNQNCLKYKA